MDESGSAATAAAPARRSARLGEDRELEILRAAYELLGEVGYEGLRFDAVAVRAKASKATLYRHWPGKAQLVADAVRTCKAAALDVPDTGSLRGDLMAWLTSIAETITTQDGSVFCGLTMAMRSDPDFAQQMRAMFETKSAATERILAQAVARGEVSADRDPHLIEEIAPPLLFMRNFGLGEAVDAAYLNHIVDDILLPLLTR